MICASRLAESLGRVTAVDTDRQVKLLKALELPVEVPLEMKSLPEDIVRFMMLDKKT